MSTWHGVMVASYADILWARHAIFLPHERGGGRLRDEPKECLRRRLGVMADGEEFMRWKISTNAVDGYKMCTQRSR